MAFRFHDCTLPSGPALFEFCNCSRCYQICFVPSSRRQFQIIYHSSRVFVSTVSMTTSSQPLTNEGRIVRRAQRQLPNESFSSLTVECGFLSRDTAKQYRTAT